MIHRLNALFPMRYTVVRAVRLCLAALGVFGRGLWRGSCWRCWLSGGLVALGVYDLRQPKRSMLRNYPIIGHIRYLLESVRPEMRQYFMESDNEATPFSRAQRSLVYQRAKGDSDKRHLAPSSTCTPKATSGSTIRWRPPRLPTHDFRITIGAGPRPALPSASVFNISAMSFGALSANAILALNAGAKRGGFAHDTGEGSISAHHRANGGDLIWEIGSGYFGCRNDDGSFNADKFRRQRQRPAGQDDRAQAQPGRQAGPRRRAARPQGDARDRRSARRAGGRGLRLAGVPQRLHHTGRNDAVHRSACASCRAASRPASSCASATRGSGSPSSRPCWQPASRPTSSSSTAPRAAPAPHRWSSPTTSARRCRKACCWCTTRCVGVDLRDRIKIGCAGKVVSAFDIARMMALGADWCNSARGFMFALGCIQAQSCHTGHCPTGVTTQDPLRQQALVVPDKADAGVQLPRSRRCKRSRNWCRPPG